MSETKTLRPPSRSVALRRRISLYHPRSLSHLQQRPRRKSSCFHLSLSSQSVMLRVIVHFGFYKETQFHGLRPRNAPCPCGSGNKYKKCCLAKDERDAAQRRISASASAGASWVLEDDGLDDLSNSVLYLIKTRRFDEALAACHLLLHNFPDVVDGLQRSAQVYAAMGDHEKAAAFYRDALAFITHPTRRRANNGLFKIITLDAA